MVISVQPPGPWKDPPKLSNTAQGQVVVHHVLTRGLWTDVLVWRCCVFVISLTCAGPLKGGGGG